MLPGATGPGLSAGAPSMLLRGTAALESLAAFASFIVFLVWLHRACAGARSELGAIMPYSPGWAVGWFFVPFANLVMPYKVMRALKQASDPSVLPAPQASVANPLASYRDPARLLVGAKAVLPRVPIGLWWGFQSGTSAAALLLTMRLIMLFVAAAQRHETNLDSIAGSYQTMVTLIAALTLVTGIFTLEIVRGIDASQLERARRLDAMNVTP
ncbi:MAG: DUF4328 domain-containing protein [Myxococcales bacterium]|nr:DUF4328 domain-containing protein [Myxococcales bacterium]